MKNDRPAVGVRRKTLTLFIKEVFFDRLEEADDFFGGELSFLPARSFEPFVFFFREDELRERKISIRFDDESLFDFLPFLRGGVAAREIDDEVDFLHVP